MPDKTTIRNANRFHAYELAIGLLEADETLTDLSDGVLKLALEHQRTNRSGHVARGVARIGEQLHAELRTITYAASS